MLPVVFTICAATAPAFTEPTPISPGRPTLVEHLPESALVYLLGRRHWESARLE